MEILTEEQYLEALKGIKKYERIKLEKIKNDLISYGLTKTPDELGCNIFHYFTDMSVRICNILRRPPLDNIRICDITKKDFISTRTAGKKAWDEFCDITGRNISEN